MEKRNFVQKIAALFTSIMLFVSIVLVFPQQKNALKLEAMSNYTIDFSYNGLDYSVLGDSKDYNLNNVFSSLGIVDSIDSIEMFDETGNVCLNNVAKNKKDEVLFDIVRQDGKWLLNSYKAFSCEFELVANESIRILIGDDASTSWQLNNTLYQVNGYFPDETITFTDENNNEYNSIKLDSDYNLFYDSTVVYYQNGSSIWTSDSYKKITFNTALKGNFLTWIEANATQIKKYSISYDLNGGDGSCPTDIAKYGLNENINLASNSNFSRTGYTFLGWSTSLTSTSPNIGNYTIASNDLPLSGSSITFYAIWGVTLNHDGNHSWTYGDGSSLASGTKITNATNLTINQKSSSKIFSIYYLNNAKETKIGVNLSLTAKEYSYVLDPSKTYSITLLENDSKIYILEYNKIYNVTYSSNTTDNVTNIPKDNNTYAFGDVLEIDNSTPNLVGYKFLGWNTNKKAKEAEVFENNEIIIQDDLILYAIWEVIPLEIGTPGTEDYIKFDKVLNASFNEGSLSSGYYYLAEDISLANDAYFTIKEGSHVVICLNGFTLNLNEEWIENNGTFTICDCSTNINYHYFEYSTSDAWTYLKNPSESNKDNAILETQITNETISGTIIKINSGIITGSSINYSAILNYGTLNLKSGVICGNSSVDNANAGGIYNTSTFNMEGGLIIGNASSSKGAGVYNSGTFNLSGGSIYDNILTGTSNCNGAGIYNSGNLIISGGNVAYNKIKNSNLIGTGGGIYNSGSIKMSGGKISDNEAYTAGGLNNYSGTFEFSGGEITNNNATNAAGVLSGLGASIIIGGTAKIKNNFKNDGITKCNLYLDNSLLTLGNGISEGKNGVKVPTSGMDIWVSLSTGLGQISNKDSNDYCDYISSDNSSYVVYFYDDAILLGNPEYTITYDANTTDTVLNLPKDNKAYVKNAKVKINSNIPTRIGYNFIGWNTNKYATNAETFTNNQIVVDDNIVLYAIWLEKTSVLISEDSQPYVYDGTSKSFIISGNITSDFTINYYVDGNWTNVAPTDAGLYNVSISRTEDENYKDYSKEITSGLIIRKKNITFEVIDIPSGIYTYDGTAHTTTANYTPLVNGDSLTYTLAYSDNVNAGTCSVTISGYTLVSGNASNYNFITASTGYIVIDKRIINVEYDDLSFVYDKKAHKPSVTVGNIVNGDVVELVVLGEQINAGSYIATIEFKEVQTNYELPSSTTQSFTIYKASIDMSGVKWNYESAFTYDGLEKTVTVYNLPKGVSVKEYTNNAKTEAGDYVASVTFNYDDSNLNFDCSTPIELNWTILKADYDMSNASWNYTEHFEFDYQEKVVEVINLPKGVSVKEYTDNRKTEKGAYVAKVTFNYDEVNYNCPEMPDLNWSIGKSIAIIDTTNLIKEYTYNGSKQVIDSGATLNHDETTLVYSDNTFTYVGIGSRTITISAAETENYLAVSVKVTIIIHKADYDLSNVSWNYSEPFTYDGKSKVVSLKGLPNNLSVKSYAGNVETYAGDYQASVTFNYDAFNYNEPIVNDLMWSIEKAESIIDTTNLVKEYTYDGNEHIIDSGATLNHSETSLFYSNNEFINVGSGKLIITISASETLNYQAKSIDVEITINKASYDMSNVKWNYVNAFKYDGLEKSVYLQGDLPEGVSIKEYIDNVKTEVGEYQASVIFDYDTINHNAPYVPVLTWNIGKMRAIIDTSELIKSYTYNGTTQIINSGAKLNHNETMLVYTNNEFCDVGDGILILHISAPETANYKAVSIDVEIKINKANYDMSDIYWNYTDSFIYDGNEKSVELNNIPDGLSLNYYTDNVKTNAGTYYAKAYFNYDEENYNEPKLSSLKWVIEKADYDLSGISWNYTNAFTYDKENKSVEVINLPSGLSVKYYIDNVYKNVGTYLAMVRFNYDEVNYNEPSIDGLSWSIVKADYDMSEVKWEYSGNYTYDGHDKIVFVSNLPNGVSVKTYSDNTKTAVGKYVASVNFVYDEINYNEPTIEDLNWEINKATFNMRSVKWNYSEAFTYDGTLKSVELTSLPLGLSVKEYIDNAKTNAGNYKASVVFDYDEANYYEPIVSDLYWSINKANSFIDTSSINKEYTYSGNEIVIDSNATLNHNETNLIYANNKFSLAGEYDVIIYAIETENYYETYEVVTIKVNKLAVKEPVVIGTYKYNNFEQTVNLANVEKYMTTTDKLTQKEVGVYNIVYVLDDNHTWDENSDGIVTWEIKALSKESKVENEGEKPDAIIESDEGIASNIEVLVEITLSDEMENKEFCIDYSKLKEYGINVENYEKVGAILKVKLIETIDGVSKEISPSEIKDGSKLTVKLLIPESLDPSNITKIVAVNDKDDIEVIDFDAKNIVDGYYIMEVDNLNEFALIYKTENYLRYKSPLIAFMIISLLTISGLIVILIFALSKKKEK